MLLVFATRDGDPDQPGELTFAAGSRFLAVAGPQRGVPAPRARSLKQTDVVRPPRAT
jgi:hypothetical protein